MSQIATLLWVAIVAFLWVGIVAGVWALVSASDEYPPEASQVTPDE